MASQVSRRAACSHVNVSGHKAACNNNPQAGTSSLSNDGRFDLSVSLSSPVVVIQEREPRIGILGARSRTQTSSVTQTRRVQRTTSVVHATRATCSCARSYPRRLSAAHHLAGGRYGEARQEGARGDSRAGSLLLPCLAWHGLRCISCHACASAGFRSHGYRSRGLVVHRARFPPRWRIPLVQ